MRKRRKRIQPRLRWVLILIVIAFPLFYFGKRAYTYGSLHRAEKRMEREVLIRQAENEVLRDRINEYKRGAVLEAKARDDLGMIKRGEQVYLVPKE
jgi:cell division protein FtsB